MYSWPATLVAALASQPCSRLQTLEEDLVLQYWPLTAYSHTPSFSFTSAIYSEALGIRSYPPSGRYLNPLAAAIVFELPSFLKTESPGAFLFCFAAPKTSHSCNVTAESHWFRHLPPPHSTVVSKPTAYYLSLPPISMHFSS